MFNRCFYTIYEHEYIDVRCTNEQALSSVGSNSSTTGDRHDHYDEGDDDDDGEDNDEQTYIHIVYILPAVQLIVFSLCCILNFFFVVSPFHFFIFSKQSFLSCIKPFIIFISSFVNTSARANASKVYTNANAMKMEKRPTKIRTLFINERGVVRMEVMESGEGEDDDDVRPRRTERSVCECVFSVRLAFLFDSAAVVDALLLCAAVVVDDCARRKRKSR